MSIFSRVVVPVLMVAFYFVPLHLVTMHFAGTPAAFAQSAPAGADQPSEETWNSIKGDIFKDRPILDGAGLVILDAPRRAEDSALVPIGMRINFADNDTRTLQSLTLVIDENPAPLAGTFPGSNASTPSVRLIGLAAAIVNLPLKFTVPGVVLKMLPVNVPAPVPVSVATIVPDSRA